MRHERPTTSTAERSMSRSRVDRLREELIPGGAFENEIAEALNCSGRQVQRLHLPFVKIGIRHVYDVPGSRDVLRRRSSAGAA
jgi:hypothetical protein